MNWVFVLIAGAMILVVAFSFVAKLRTAAKVKIADTLAKDIEAIATGAIVAKGGAQKVSVPKENVQFSCTDECSCSIRVGPGERPYKEKFIFAPDNLEDIEIIFISMDWKVPFRVSNFLFASNKFVKYFILYEEGDPAAEEIVGKLQKKMHEDLRVAYIDIEELGDLMPQNFDEIKFVLINTPPMPTSDFTNFAKVDFNIVRINPSNNQLIFFDKKSKKRLDFFDPVESSYTGDAALFAAIFADDSVMYNCNMEKAVKRMSYIAQIYADRARFLHSQVISPGGPIGHCSGYLDSANKLDLLASDLADITAIVDDTFGQLGGDINSIETDNNNFLLASCPLLY